MVERNFYTSEFKRMVAKAYYASSKSMVTIGKEFKVNPSTVALWVKRYASDYRGSNSIRQEISTFGSVIQREPTMKKEKLTPEQMQRRLEELEAQLKHEQMRSITLDKMIDIAEQELKISIRKKSGAKQSN
ncbi:MAG: helix-turn-helix domain-containing protein [Tannerellaceae bacterium]|nr:helix-turn-helix domain-containing protein [Tannerellaceae bacterium]